MTESTAVAIPERWTREIQRYESQHYNILAPKELGDIPPYHTPHMSVIQIDPNTDAGEVYPLPGGKLGLSKVVLDKIAQAGSITWIPDACKSGWRTPRKYFHTAVGVVKGLDGQRRTIIGTKEIDLDVVDEELRQNLPKRWDRMNNKPKCSFEQWAKNSFAEESLQFKKHVAARAESGAKNRAIRSAYGLKSAYSRSEIERPFVIPRLVLSPDMSDPETRKLVLADALGVIPELYGKTTETKALPPALPEAPDDEPLLTENSGNGDQPEPKDTEPSSTPQPSDPPPPDASVLFLEAFAQEQAAGSPEVKAEALADQVKALESLINESKYDVTKLKAPLGKFTREERSGFHKHLLTMIAERRKAEAKAQEEMPWGQ